MLDHLQSKFYAIMTRKSKKAGKKRTLFLLSVMLLSCCIDLFSEEAYCHNRIFSRRHHNNKYCMLSVLNYLINPGCYIKSQRVLWEQLIC